MHLGRVKMRYHHICTSKSSITSRSKSQIQKCWLWNYFSPSLTLSPAHSKLICSLSQTEPLFAKQLIAFCAEPFIGVTAFGANNCHCLNLLDFPFAVPHTAGAVASVQWCFYRHFTLYLVFISILQRSLIANSIVQSKWFHFLRFHFPFNDFVGVVEFDVSTVLLVRLFGCSLLNSSHISKQFFRDSVVVDIAAISNGFDTFTQTCMCTCQRICVPIQIKLQSDKR